ncbi:MAG: hypothetical protein RO469_12740 [Thermincola sp.]|jgi:hypothetical protein|nr:hypothetical protein [Thermincola sp.]MDT3701575.1 hypothetical protein [Thermincola sp.]
MNELKRESSNQVDIQKTVNNMKQKPWLIPGILLVILILLMVFRWDYQATKSRETSVLKWKTDRWTGQQWFEIYAPSAVIKRPIPNTEEAANKTRVATNYWWMAVLASGIWFIYSAWYKPWRSKLTNTKSQLDNDKSNLSSPDTNIPQEPKPENNKNNIKYDDLTIPGATNITNSAMDPTLMADLSKHGAIKIAKGAVKYGQWAKEMFDEFGSKIAPYLKDIYANSKELHSRYINGDREIINLLQGKTEKRI